MELTRRSNFKIDITNIATADVVIKKGLKPIDFIGVIVEGGQDVLLITAAAENNGAVRIAMGGGAELIYNPTTGKITIAESEPSNNNS